MNLETDIQNAKEALRNADAILITAGAGMGVDSGLPDFRGNQGFWNAYPEAKKTWTILQRDGEPRMV